MFVFSLIKVNDEANTCSLVPLQMYALDALLLMALVVVRGRLIKLIA